MKPDYIEVLPGIMPQVISKMCKVSKAPIIAGGLISEKESVMSGAFDRSDGSFIYES